MFTRTIRRPLLPCLRTRRTGPGTVRIVFSRTGEPALGHDVSRSCAAALLLEDRQHLIATRRTRDAAA